MAEENKEVKGISVDARVPDFWTDQPELWFLQYEAAVLPQHASDAAQFQLLVTKLGKQVLPQVTDILQNPPDKEKYKTIKARLLSVYQESEDRKLQRLVGEMQLGEQKPSQLLRCMQNLAGTSFQDSALRTLWQGHLPVAVRTALAASSVMALTELAAMADKVMESLKPVEVASVSTGSSEESRITAQMEELSMEVAELRRERRRWNEDRRAGTQFRKDYVTQQGRPLGKKLCYYHQRFGAKAFKCRNPCSWKGKVNQGN